MTAVNFIQVGPGGLCFAHGPYEKGDKCPRWPACATTQHNPKWVEEGTRLVRQSRERPALEHALATAFTTMQRERVPAERQKLWAECLRLSAELEKLNGSDNNSGSD